MKLHTLSLAQAAGFLLLLGLVFGGGTAHAQTVYTATNGTNYNVPADYQAYNNNGVFYNPSVGTYYNALTGTYSSNAPSSNGNIPTGFTYWGGNYYYNTSTGQYYDSSTGVYSTSIPSATGPSVTAYVSGTPGTTFNIPSGYMSASNGLYYNSSTGLFFCPTNGLFSSSISTCPATTVTNTYVPPTTTAYVAPTSYSGPVYSSTAGTIYNPGFPNTGVNTAKRNFDIALAAMAVVLGGILLMVRARKDSLSFQR